jgi:protein phosphatase 1 regulatory subunit 7
MGIRIVDSFQFFDGLSRDYIIVEEDRLDQYIDYINDKYIKHVSISPTLGYKLKEDIDFISRCPDIEYLSITTPFIKDYSPLHNLMHLRSLHLDIPNAKVDLARIPNIEEFSTSRFINILNLDKCKKLKDLGITYYNPKNRNMDELATLENLINLGVVRSRIESLKGLGNLHRLKHIFLYNFPNLRCLDELENISGNLIVLRFVGCKRIENFEYVSCLKQLKVLAFDNCGDIPNIKFIKQMPELKAFVFVDSNIVDGDLSPCIGLEFVGFLNKRHYSHKRDGFPTNKLSPEIETLARLH